MNGQRTTVQLLAVVLVSCSGRASPSEAPGTYRMTHAGRTDTIEICPDGTFSHRVVSQAGVLLAERGLWEWDLAPPPLRNVDLISFTQFSTMVAGMEGHGIWPATVDKYFGRIRLTLNEDRDLYYDKVTSDTSRCGSQSPQ